ncbi:hypothetical protein [Ectothiorhodospira sp. BSL-9]|uniref:hypothetical protein n=1 Tax=Ectothiorhodospira sp. BSL-9 TaxID=1442136 RepID=UPI0007B458F7|nr:hypothetical protein [Ectothiorhodospira sp. BSL-9]ANB01640.1 hypothetical protein ECTOBSL9_0797 [Ectothiorhodospira sp. BSL-9]
MALVFALLAFAWSLQVQASGPGVPGLYWIDDRGASHLLSEQIRDQVNSRLPRGSQPPGRPFANQDQGVVVVDGGVEFTVGANGHFQSLNEALGVASAVRSRHSGERGEGVVVTILEGVVLNEQVNMHNTDLSHIRLTGNSPVMVDTTGFANADDDRGSAPFFNLQFGSESPKIDVIFEQVAGGDAVGLLANRGSSAVLTPNGGFVGFRDGATVNNGSTLTGRFSTLQGSRWAIHARHMSDANLRSARLDGGDIGAWARRASRIDARAADLSGHGSGEGLRADNVSLIEAHGAVINQRAIAANAFRGGQINLLSANLANTGTAMQVSDGGFIYAHGLGDLSNVGQVFSIEPNTFSARGVILTDLAVD